MVGFVLGHRRHVYTTRWLREYFTSLTYDDARSLYAMLIINVEW